jgi:proteasome lid subunit RPN8/RPN11
LALPPRTSARLPASLRDEIIAAARAALPNESVGLLVGDGAPRRYMAMVNAAASPYRYAIDPAEQLRVWTALDEAGESVWAIVHSHVSSAAEPSKTDVELAYYPESLYLICSLADTPQPVIRAWSIVSGAVSEVLLAADEPAVH